MIKQIKLSVLLILICNSGFSQYNINRYIPKISFEIPDKTNWTMVSDDIAGANAKGALIFKHKPIMDSKKRPVEPMIAVIYEKIAENIDVIQYSAGILGDKPFKIKSNLLGGYPDYSSDKHSVVFSGEYVRENVKHKIFLGYILCNNVGIEIICDATDEVYSKVESDFKRTLKSFRMKE